MIAYKFLRAGAVGPFSGFAWPAGAPGDWVEAEPHLCASGIHACRARDLPYWLNAELWEIELADATDDGRKVVARRGRLVRRVEGWNHAALHAFGDACAAEAESRSPEYGSDARKLLQAGDVAGASFVAARAAEVVGGAVAYEAERRRQAEWLADRLELAYA